MTFSSDPERGKKEEPPSGTCARGRDDGNSRTQNDECKIHKDGTAAQLQDIGGNG